MQIRFLTGPHFQRNQEKKCLGAERRLSGGPAEFTSAPLFCPTTRQLHLFKRLSWLFPLRFSGTYHVVRKMNGPSSSSPSVSCVLCSHASRQRHQQHTHTCVRIHTQDPLSLLWIYLHIPFWKGILLLAVVNTFR